MLLLNLHSSTPLTVEGLSADKLTRRRNGELAESESQLANWSNWIN